MYAFCPAGSIEQDRVAGQQDKSNLVDCNDSFVNARFAAPSFTLFRGSAGLNAAIVLDGPIS